MVSNLSSAISYYEVSLNPSDIKDIAEIEKSKRVLNTSKHQNEKAQLEKIIYAAKRLEQQAALKRSIHTLTSVFLAFSVPAIGYLFHEVEAESQPSQALTITSFLSAGFLLTGHKIRASKYDTIPLVNKLNRIQGIQVNFQNI